MSLLISNLPQVEKSYKMKISNTTRKSVSRLRVPAELVKNRVSADLRKLGNSNTRKNKIEVVVRSGGKVITFYV